MTISVSPTGQSTPDVVTGRAALESSVEQRAFPLGDGWVIRQPDKDRLLVLNATAKIVWDLSNAGLPRDEIASAFALHFGLSFARASADISTLVASIDDERISRIDPLEPMAASPLAAASAACGVFRFDHRMVKVFSTVPELGPHYFSRFRHRASEQTADADTLEFSGVPSDYRLTFRHEITAIVGTLPELVAKANELFFGLEHSEVDLLAYFHAAAVSLAGRALLLPGSSGVGKSTLVGYLASNGFTYLGDDVIAMAADMSLRALPTRLSLKSGSWPVLEPCYPQLSHCPVVQCHGRAVRYVEAKNTSKSAGAPSAILFPYYTMDQDSAHVSLTPLQTITRLFETATDLHKPATDAKVRALLHFVETTPAYQLSYCSLPSALNVIARILETAP